MDPTLVPAWRDMSEEEAKTAVLERNESLLVIGPPGSGKSYFTRELVKELRKRGNQVDVIAKTHAAVANFGEGAQTADHFVRQRVRAGHVFANVLVVEEITQLEVQLWADIAKASMLPSLPTFILCGDFLQFPAICEHWAGSAVPEGSLERSSLVRELTTSNRLVLTDNKRSDGVLFSFYTNLMTRPLADVLGEARVMFPVTERRADTTLVISHAKRRWINAQCNLRDKQPGAVFLRAPHAGNAQAPGTGPQSMWVWTGLRVIGAGGALRKGVFDTVALVSDEGDGGTVQLEGGAKLSFHQAIRSLRLCYAITYASCQGLTLPGVVRLDDTDNKHFSIRHLYVGTSRATAHDLLEVC